MSLRLRFREKSVEDFVAAFSRNVGKDGMFVLSKKPLAKGVDVRFEFLLADQTPVFAGEGTVRWSRVEGDPQGPPGMGIQFKKLSAESLPLLTRMRARGKPEPLATQRVVPPTAKLSPTRQSWEFLVPDPNLPRTGPIIGIDLGTSNCCVSVIQGGRPLVLPSRDGYPTIPSVVAVNPLGKMLVGRMAKEQRLLNPAQTVYGMKRLVGRAYESATVQAVKEHFPYQVCADENGLAAVKLMDRVVTLEQIQGFLLQECKRTAEHHLGEPVRRAVVTVPAYYTEVQRQAVRRAGALAGLHVERTINEPTAAALAYGLNRELARKVVIYDLGGGTFDASVLRVQNNAFEVLATGGDTFLGGLDFDQTLVDYLVGQFQLDEEVNLEGEDIALARIADAAETAKIALSERLTTEVHLPQLVIDKQGRNRDLRVTLNRVDLELACGKLVERSLDVVKKVLGQADLKPADVDEVVVVGGQSRMPLVRERIRAMFGKSPHAGVHPDEAIAQGAALLAGTLTSDAPIDLIDVLPVGIGMGLSGGKFQLLLRANTSLPAKTTVYVRNEKNDAPMIEVSLFQGDEDRVAGNDYLGVAEIRGVPPGAKGKVRVALTLKLDKECQLSVEARDEFGKELRTALKLQHAPGEVLEKLALKQKEADAVMSARASELSGRGGSFWGLLKRAAGKNPEPK
ncbi:MAG: TIGR02266 family protein [Myxococcaceae bacterium]